MPSEPLIEEMQGESSGFLVECWCRDCTGEDFMGCYDGHPWTLGPFATREEAEQAGHEETDECGPWEFEVKEVTA